MLVNRAGMMVLPFLSVYLHTSLGFSLKQTGLAMTFFGVGSIVGSIFGGYLTDRMGFIKVQLLSLFLSSGMFLLLLVTEKFLFFCVLLFFTSLFTDIFRPANLAAIRGFSRPENRTRSLSLVRMAVNLGFAIGPAVGGLLITLIGYHSIFWVNSGTMLAAAGMIFIAFVKREPRYVEDSPEDEAAASKARSPYTDAPFILLLISMILTVTSFIQLMFTIPVYFKELGYNEDSIGLFMAFNCLLVVIFEMPLIYYLERRYNLPFLMALGAILIAFGYFALNFVPWIFAAIIIYIFGISFGEMVTFPTANSQALTMAGKKRAGKYMGLFTLTFSISFALAPLFGMYVAEEFGFSALWYISGAIGLIGAGGFLYLQRMPFSHAASSEVV